MSPSPLIQAADSWMFWMTAVIVQATVVALIALAIVRWSKRLPANVKYVLLLLAMVKFFTPPFMGWPIGIFSQFKFPAVVSESEPTEQSFLVEQDTNIDAATTSAGRNEMSDTLTAVAIISVQESKVPSSADVSTQTQMVTSTSTDVAITTTLSPSAATSVLLSLNISVWLMLCWLIGVIALAFRMLQGFVCLRRIVQRSVQATGDCQSNFPVVARSMNVRRTQLLLSPEPVTPMACGLFRPMVIIPRSLVERFTPDEQRAIFAHELAHHRRFDPLVLWIQWGFVAIWWFHPLAWALNRAILRLREHCCDDLVLVEKQATQETYGAALLRSVEWYSTRIRILDYAAPQMSSLKDRIVSLIDPQTTRASRLSFSNWVAVTVLGLAVLPGFGTLASETVADTQAVAGPQQKPVADAQTNDTQTRNPDGSATPDSANDKSRCIVGGRVLNEQGLPIRAKVWLRTGSGGEIRFQNSETDHNGRYQFVNIEPGWTGIAALGDGYSHSGTLFTLQKGRIEKNLNLIATEPKSMTLNIRNEQGEPVAGAEVWSIQWKTASRSEFGLYPKLMEAEQIEIPKSDAAGLLLFPRLPANANCTVYLRHPDYVGAKLTNLDVNQPVNVTLESGYPIVVTALNAETSEPVADATVRISGSPGGMNVTNATVAADGTFRTRLPVKTQLLNVTVMHPDLSTPGCVKREYRDGIVYYEARLHRRGLVRGRVIDETTGEAVSGVQVSLSKQGTTIKQAVSGKDGTYELPTPAGSYFHVSVHRAEGFYSGVYKEPMPGDQYPFDPVLVPAPPLDVKVKPDESVVLSDLTVNRLPKVKGVVRLPDGQPAAGVVVQDNAWPPKSFRTDADGRFEFDGKQPGLIHLKAYHLTQPLMADAGMTMKDWFAGTEHEIRLQRSADVTGKVLDQNERPVAGLQVSLVSSMSFGPGGKVGKMISVSIAALAVTDDNGDFRFTGLSRDMGYSAVVGTPYSETSPQSNQIQPPLNSTQFEPIRLPAGPPAVAAPEVAAPEVAAPEVVAPRIAPPVECGHWLNSPAITAEATQGKVVLLHFCDIESEKSTGQLAATQEIHDLYNDKGCVAVAVFRSSDAVADVEAMAKELHLSCPIAIDNDTGDTFNSFDVNYAPNFVLIGRDGRIISNRVADYDLLIQVRQAVMDAKSEQ